MGGRADGTAFLPVLVSVGLLYRNWPTGIRLDAVARRRPTVNHQSWGWCTCPWSAVLNVRVVTDRGELRRLRDAPEFYTLTNRWSNKRQMRRCNIGVLTSPFMRAALVVEVNPLAVTPSDIRPARFFTNFKDGYFSHLVRPQPSATWVVPTRRPEALQAVLRTFVATRTM